MKSFGKIVVDDAEVRRRLVEKKECRLRDAKALADGKITPQALQHENSMFTREWIQSLEIPDYFQNVGVS